MRSRSFEARAMGAIIVLQGKYSHGEQLALVFAHRIHEGRDQNLKA
jgi:hypothetical protein